jgi:hypothetical protein
MVYLIRLLDVDSLSHTVPFMARSEGKTIRFGTCLAQTAPRGKKQLGLQRQFGPWRIKTVLAGG